MRQYKFSLVLAALLFFSCQKNNFSNSMDNSLEGKWRMISVKDNASNNIVTKPSDIIGDVDISFVFSTSTMGIMSGVTPTNSLTGEYTIGNNGAISIPDVSQTKVMETSWGFAFLNNIRYSKNYFFDNNRKLNITTSTNKTLIFSEH